MDLGLCPKGLLERSQGVGRTRGSLRWTLKHLFKDVLMAAE